MNDIISMYNIQKRLAETQNITFKKYHQSIYFEPQLLSIDNYPKMLQSWNLDAQIYVYDG